jgi:hypothetical protein
MTLDEFQRQVYSAAAASPICDIPLVWRLTSTSIKLRIEIASGGFIDAFFNEQTGTAAFALIRRGARVFGADNTGGWHVHPFEDPTRHDPLANPMTFGEFVATIEGS